MALLDVRQSGLQLSYWIRKLVNLQLGFQSASKLLVAQNLTMPAMSPTMTEGNIASWKVKEGKGNACDTVYREPKTVKLTV